MFNRRNNFFQPFINSFIPFIITNGSNPEYSTISILREVDLDYQPLEEPLTATLFAFLRVFVVIIGLLIHVKALKMVNKETGLLSEVTKFFIWTQIIFLPSMVGFIISTDFMYPMNEIVGQWYCTLGWSIFLFGALVITSHSFVTALMRYFFIIYEKKAEKFGKEKAKKLGLYVLILIPMIVVITGAIEGSELTWMSFINKCYGNHHKVYLIEHSTISSFDKKILRLETDELRSYTNIILAILWRISKVIRSAVVLLMGFNIVEGFLYYKILSHLHRTHKQSMVKLRKLLSSTSRSRRHRKNILNIQITILAWLVEFVGFLLVFLGSFILKRKDSIVTLSMQTFTFFVYFVIVPSVFLVNDPYIKGVIVESRWYIKLLNLCSIASKFEEQNGEEEVQNRVDENMEMINANCDTPEPG